MICPYCGSNRTRRSGRRGLAEGLLFRLFRRAPFRCLSCHRRFVDSKSSQRLRRRGGKRRSLAAYLGLRRGQRSKLRLAFIGSLLVILVVVISMLVKYFLPSPEDQNPLHEWKGHLMREKPR